MVSLANVRPLTADQASQKPGILKRKLSDTPSPDPSVTKRPRVAFDDNVREHPMPGYKEKGIDLVREEVKRALSKRAENDSTAYDQVKSLFSKKSTDEDAPSTSLLRKYVIALKSESARLDRSCSDIVYAALGCNWALRDDDFVQAFKEFVKTVATAHMGYCEVIYKEITSIFSQPPRSNARHPDDPTVLRSEVWERAHECLGEIYRKVPSSATTLRTVLYDNFPHVDDNTKYLANYITNLFKLAARQPSLNGEVQRLILQQLVKIDNAIQEDMDELEEGADEDLVDELNDGIKDGESDGDSDAGSVSSDGSLDDDEATARLKMLKEKAKKLDTLLDMVFEHYHDVFVHGGYQARTSFSFLLNQFSQDILATERTRHVQFLLFHYAQIRPDFAEEFITRCCHITLDENHTRSVMERNAAAAYLGSFVARGAHVDKVVVRQLFSVLCNSLNKYERHHANNKPCPDRNRYGPYYAQAQALFYIFCFRWRDLIVMRDDDDNIYDSPEDAISSGAEFEWFNNVNEMLGRSILSPFNPLKVCSPDVVQQFADIARYVRFLEVLTKLEMNKRVRLGRTVGMAASSILPERETALSGRSGDSHYQLDAYFPFDPYRLPRSKRWLEGDYVEWKSPYAKKVIEEESDSSSESESDDDMGGDVEEEEPYEEGTATETSV